MDPFSPYLILYHTDWTDFIKLCSLNMEFYLIGAKALQSPDKGPLSSLLNREKRDTFAEMMPWQRTFTWLLLCCLIKSFICMLLPRLINVAGNTQEAPPPAEAFSSPSPAHKQFLMVVTLLHTHLPASLTPLLSATYIFIYNCLLSPQLLLPFITCLHLVAASEREEGCLQ